MNIKLDYYFILLTKESDTKMKHKHTLREEKQYARLFAAGIVNGIGDRFSQVAVLGLLLSLTGSGLAVGITFAVRLVPYLLFGPLGGMLADRFSKNRS